MATGNEEPAIDPQRLLRHAQQVQAFSHNLQARVAEVAAALARTDEDVAATMIRLAASHPERAEWLEAISESARKQAAQARQWGELAHADTAARLAGCRPPSGTD
jgi:Skp family chaperone for outer membrane proteins